MNGFYLSARTEDVFWDVMVPSRCVIPIVTALIATIKRQHRQKRIPLYPKPPPFIIILLSIQIYETRNILLIPTQLQNIPVRLRRIRHIHLGWEPLFAFAHNRKFLKFNDDLMRWTILLQMPCVK